MSKKRKVIILSSVVLIIILAGIYTVISYYRMSNIAKNIEDEYYKFAALLETEKMSAGTIECRSGMILKCKVGSILVDKYDEIYLENIDIGVSGSKKKANVTLGFDIHIDKNKDIDFLNDSHVFCKYNGNIVSRKSLLESKLMCEIKEKNKDTYSYTISLNHISDFLKDANIPKLVSQDNRDNVIKAIENMDNYLNYIEFKAAVSKNKSIEDLLSASRRLRGYSKEELVDLFNEIEDTEKYKNSSKEFKQIVSLLKNIILNNHRKITIKLEANEKNKIKLGPVDFTGIDFIVDRITNQDFSDIKLTTSSN